MEFTSQSQRSFSQYLHAITPSTPWLTFKGNKTISIDYLSKKNSWVFIYFFLCVFCGFVANK